MLAVVLIDSRAELARVAELLAVVQAIAGGGVDAQPGELRSYGLHRLYITWTHNVQRIVGVTDTVHVLFHTVQRCTWLLGRVVGGGGGSIRCVLIGLVQN